MFSKARQLLTDAGRANPGRGGERALHLNLVLVLVLIILPISGVGVFA